MDHYRGGKESGGGRKIVEGEDNQRERERKKGSRKLEIVNRERFMRR